MAELRRISFQGGSHVNHGDDDGNTNGHRKGHRKSSYELETLHHKTQKNGASGHDSEAVVVRNACKHYNKKFPVLQNLNMTVKKGTIYSLLGSSGCGKTTTLSCIVGVRKLNEGDVWVFGARPGVKGKKVGYMPQETSLFRDFSIAETLSYFGTLCGMDSESAQKRTAFQIDLLSLPDSARRVGTLSGGQRRRVSFAVALIHEPELLVLDEPTVGVDPLLRESIWKHLVHLSTERGTTVLITTHYIDEAKDSTTVGVMRFGRLLVEQDPTKLLQLFDTTSMEYVVLQLCRKEAGMEEEGAGTNQSQVQKLEELQYNIEAPDNSDYTPPHADEDANIKISDSFKRVRSLIYKNIVVLLRNLLLSLFAAVMPAFITYIMCIAFKDDPKDLQFGVVNYEVTNNSFCLFREERAPGECDVENLSCKYIENIPPGAMDLIYYDTEEDAAAHVHKGSIWGYMVFPEDYSSFFYERAAGGATIDEDVFNRSEIIVKMDQTSKNVVNRLKKSLYDGFEDFAKAILRDCGFDERQAEAPLNYQTPIFGTDDTKFVDFIAPSFAVVWLFFFPIIASSVGYINDKKEGTFDRSLVAGTNTWEILVGYGVSEFLVLFAQSLVVFAILTWIVGIELHGSPILVILLLLLSGFGGVSLGFFIGSLCNEEIEAALLAMALFFPNTLVSGVFWPSEGMPIALQYISYALPCTLSAESMRSIYTRGWPLTHFHVWPGFATLVGWILFYFILTVLVQKIRTNNGHYFVATRQLQRI